MPITSTVMPITSTVMAIWHRPRALLLIHARGSPGPMTRQLACKGPKGGMQAGRTDTMPSLQAAFEWGKTKPLSVSRTAVA
eukprot:3753209-Pyramimonas_sp.AAC.1